MWRCWTSECLEWTVTKRRGGRVKPPDGRGLTPVAVTGWGQEEDRRRTRSAGFDHHLVKPVDFSLLQAILSGVSPA